MDFTNMKVKGIRCNIGTGKLMLTFEGKLTEERLAEAQALAACGEDMPMDVSVQPMQLRMMPATVTTEVVTTDHTVRVDPETGETLDEEKDEPGKSNGMPLAGVTMAQAMSRAAQMAEEQNRLMFLYQCKLGSGEWAISETYHHDWLFKVYPGGRQQLSLKGSEVYKAGEA